MEEKKEQLTPPHPTLPREGGKREGPREGGGGRARPALLREGGEGEAPTSGAAPVLPRDRYLNRELSLLNYHGRVLARAEDPALPLLERVRSLHYFARAMDDFFQIRVAGLKAQLQTTPGARSLDGRTASEQVPAVRFRVDQLDKRQRGLWQDELVPALAEAGIHLVDAGALTGPERDFLADLFATRVAPVLIPLAVDPAHPFPYISNLSLNVGVVIRDPVRGVERFARVKVPPRLPRFVALPGGGRFVPFEQVIASHLGELFTGMEIVSHFPFRVTRDNDLEIEEEGPDELLAAMQVELVRFRQRARPVRLEVGSAAPDQVRAMLARELDLTPDDVYVVEGLLDLGDVGLLADLDRPDLKAEPYQPVNPPALMQARGEGIFGAIRRGDVLLHHPYDSYAATVVPFIQEAAADPDVVAIEQTLYRTSGPASPIALALIKAAESGKQVAALVELRARGDEQANIEWAQRLEQAGVHVVHGVVGLKTHAKLLLVVRDEGGSLRRYCHVATGTYNPTTAKGYEDIGLLTSNPEIGADVGELFNFLTGYSRQNGYRRLLVAPHGLRSGILELIRDEAAARDGRIVIKVNSLVDQRIIDALYEASRAGAEIDLVVRGVCCLRPGVPGLSERIRVRSLVGGFLEHSRIFRFGSDQRGPRYLIGSADMMDRNLDRRVEALVPVDDPQLRRQLAAILELELQDDTLAWELRPDGSWMRANRSAGIDSQQRLGELAHDRARLTLPPS